jgi:acetolactate synthase-1/3 small subunit
MRHVISALVMNEPGVLAGVANMFSARGFNIDSLVVGRTEDPGLSRMTIVVSGDDNTLDQVRKQLAKLVPIVSVHDFLHEAYIERDLALVSVSVDQQTRSHVVETVKLFGGKVVDVSREAVMAELTGTEDEIERFVDLVRDYGIKELARTGVIAMARAAQTGREPGAGAAQQAPARRKRSIDAPAAQALPPS